MCVIGDGDCLQVRARRMGNSCVGAVDDGTCSLRVICVTDWLSDL